MFTNVGLFLLAILSVGVATPIGLTDDSDYQKTVASYIVSLVKYLASQQTGTFDCWLYHACKHSTGGSHLLQDIYAGLEGESIPKLAANSHFNWSTIFKKTKQPSLVIYHLEISDGTPSGRSLNIAELFLKPFQFELWSLFFIGLITVKVMSIMIPNSFKNDPLFLPICGFEQYDLNRTSRMEKLVMISLIVMFFFISNAYETKIISLMSSKPRVKLVSTLQSILDSGTTVKSEYHLSQMFPMFETLYDTSNINEDQLDGTSVYLVNGDVGLLLVQRMINWDYESNQPRYRIMEERFAMGVGFYPIPLRSPARPHYRFVLKALFEAGILIRWRHEYIALSNSKRFPLIKPGVIPNSFKNDPLFLPICGFEQYDLNQTSRSEKSVMIALIVMFFFVSNAYETKIISLMSSKPRVNLVSTLQSILDSGTTVKAEYQLTKTFPMFESLYDSAHMHEDQLDGTSVYFVNGDVGLLLVQRMINWDYESNQPRYRIMKERFALGIAFYPIPLRSPARPHYRFVLRALFESGIMIRWRGEFIALSNSKRYPLIKPGGVNPT
ncbi:hypothetical protein pipiens_017070, partial [Culex pipiens pipiens]